MARTEEFAADITPNRLRHQQPPRHKLWRKDTTYCIGRAAKRSSYNNLVKVFFIERNYPRNADRINGTRRLLARSRRQAACHVVAHMGGEQLFELLRYGTRRRGDAISRDFSHTDEVTVRRGDEYFIGGVQIFWA